MNYFDLPQLNNSELSRVKRQLENNNLQLPKTAFETGSYVDALVTEEKHVSDFIYMTSKILGEKEKAMSYNMSQKLKSELPFIDSFEGQKVCIGQIMFEINGLNVSFETKCKFDLFKENIGIDLKTTAAKSHKSFEDSILRFEYYRQAAFYMDTALIDNFHIIGISKEFNPKIFKKAIRRDDDNYKLGVDQYKKLMYAKYMLDL